MGGKCCLISRGKIDKETAEIIYTLFLSFQEAKDTFLFFIHSRLLQLKFIVGIEEEIRGKR